MKTKIIITLILISSIFIGCKNEKSEKDTNQEPVIETFNIILDVLVKKNDNFQVYYMESSDENFSEEKSLWLEVKGMDTPQQITFNLPKDVVPSLIRLDLGIANNQEDIKLTSFSLEYFGKTFSAKGNLMANYFRPLAGTEIDFNTGIIKTVVKDGKRLEPVLHPHEIPLGDEIAKLVK